MNIIAEFIINEANGMDYSDRGITDIMRTAQVFVESLKLECSDEKLSEASRKIMDVFTDLASDPNRSQLKSLLTDGLDLLEDYGRFVLVQSGKDATAKGYPAVLAALGISEEVAGIMVTRRESNDMQAIERFSAGQVYTLIDEMLLDFLVIADAVLGKLSTKCEIAESMEYFPDIYVRKIIEEYENEESNGFKYIDFHWEDREGLDTDVKIEELLSDSKETSRYIKFLGEAGSGKSTAMRRIEYILADQYMSSGSGLIPVYVPLCDVTEAGGGLIGFICNKIRLPKSDVESCLAEGKLLLLLDGYNEILDPKLLKTMASYIDNTVCRLNPKTRVIMSDRVVTRESLPVMQNAEKLYLKKIPNEDKLAFFKAFLDPEKYNLILEKMRTRPKYFDKIDSPFKMKQLADVVNKYNELPHHMELTSRYLESLIDRERNEKKELEMRDVEDFLQAIAIYLYQNNIDEDNIDEDNTNEGLSRVDMLIKLSEIGRKLGVNSDVKKILDLAIGMKILISDSYGYIRFYSPEYQTYFRNEGANRGLDALFRD